MRLSVPHLNVCFFFLLCAWLKLGLHTVVALQLNLSASADNVMILATYLIHNCTNINLTTVLS